MLNTKVKEFMTEHPTLISPESTISKAAAKMRDIDCGILPIGNESKLEGILTDRDIVLRVLAENLDANKVRVKDIMTPHVVYCGENDTLRKAASLMHKYDVSRLVVRDGTGKITGILSFGCILRKDNSAEEIISCVESALGKTLAA